MIAHAPDWLEANQRLLSLAIGDLRAALTRHAARLSEPEGGCGTSADDQAPMSERTASPARRFSPPAAMQTLAEACGLTPFEQQILLLCAGMELDAGVASDCERAQGVQRAYATFGLALAALPGAHWSALLPDSGLRYWQLVDFAPGGSPSAPLTSRPLRIDERVLHYLTGLTHLDARLATVAAAVPHARALVPSQRAIAEQLAAAWAGGSGRTPAVVLSGPDIVCSRAVAAAACQANGWRLYAMHQRCIPTDATQIEVLARLWRREFRLDAVALLIEADEDSPDAARDSSLRAFVDRMASPLAIVGNSRVRLAGHVLPRFELAKPTAAEQRHIWTDALGSSGGGNGCDLDSVVEQFSFDMADIQAAAASTAALPSPEAPAQTLWVACRQQSRGRLDDLAQRISTAATLDDLVLPDQQKEVLQDIVRHVRHRSMVHGAWGFGAASSRGLGMTALFAGPSGTGKTMAAEVVAAALDLDLYRVDLSAVVSKYIGETEKHLHAIFAAADAGGAILLFDEADALFGRRSEVRDSHDRYSNLEVSYLLQRMECYRGLAILTTNMASALDSAFLRRIRFIVKFPFPDHEQRVEIWRRVFPPATPTQGLDPDRLAQLTVAGGSIRNVAVQAAFLAADENCAVGMPHVLRAARSEYAKLEKPLTNVEVAGWVESAPC